MKKLSLALLGLSLLSALSLNAAAPQPGAQSAAPNQRVIGSVVDVKPFGSGRQLQMTVIVEQPASFAPGSTVTITGAAVTIPQLLAVPANEISYHEVLMLAGYVREIENSKSGQRRMMADELALMYSEVANLMESKMLGKARRSLSRDAAPETPVDLDQARRLHRELLESVDVEKVSQESKDLLFSRSSPRLLKELRSTATALEAYFVDWNRYPPMQNKEGKMYLSNSLTTPVAYMTRLTRDPFAPEADSIGYFMNKDGWILYSVAPDLDQDYDPKLYDPATTNAQTMAPFQYDPSNGMLSSGDIFRLKQ